MSTEGGSLEQPDDSAADQPMDGVAHDVPSAEAAAAEMGQGDAPEPMDTSFDPNLKIKTEDEVKTEQSEDGTSRKPVLAADISGLLF